MNKFIILCLATLAACAAAGPIDVETDSQSFLNPTDSEETASLADNKRVFADFCVSSRDYIYSDVKSKTNGFAGFMFRLVFNSVGSVGESAISAQRLAVDRLANQIENPNAEIAAATNTVEEMVAEGQKKIQEEQTQPKTMIQAFLTTVSTTGSVVQQGLVKGFEVVKNNLGTAKAISLLEDACNKIAAYEEELRSQFDAFKSEAVTKDASLASVTFESVPCVTSVRVIRADGACKFAKAAQAPVSKILTTARN